MLLAILKQCIIVIPILFPINGIIKWNNATTNGNNVKNFLFLIKAPILNDKEKVSIDKDTPIKKMDTNSCIFITNKIYVSIYLLILVNI